MKKSEILHEEVIRKSDKAQNLLESFIKNPDDANLFREYKKTLEDYHTIHKAYAEIKISEKILGI